jgi:hypothetical protein
MFHDQLIKSWPAGSSAASAARPAPVLTITRCTHVYYKWGTSCAVTLKPLSIAVRFQVG